LELLTQTQWRPKQPAGPPGVPYPFFRLIRSAAYSTFGILRFTAPAAWGKDLR